MTYRPRFSTWLGFAGVVLAVALMLTAGLTTRLELRWLDLQYQWLRSLEVLKSDDAVVVVGIDDASLKQFGVPVATLHRQIGQFLEAMAVANARAVGLDLVLPETSYDALLPGLDAALAKGIISMRAVAPLVLGIGSMADGSPRPLHPLFERLTGPDGQGIAFVRKDSDGVVRRFDERLGVNQETVATLAGQLARRMNLPVDAGLIPMFRGQRFGYIPLHEVLSRHAANDNDYLQHAFAGKVVLLGSLLAHDDQLPVPLALASGDTGSTTHGVFVHAMQLRGLLTGNLIKELPNGLGTLVAIMLTLNWWLKPGKRAWLGSGVLLMAILIASPLLLRAGWAMPAPSWCLALLSGLGARTALKSWQVSAERHRLRRAFDGAVSPAVLKEILAGRLHPKSAGERREICVLFSDIRNFTALSEHLPPEIVTDFLNRYFEHMAGAIHRHHGTLDKFIGDGIMAVFGAPKAGQDCCGDAFRSAQEMLAQLDIFNRDQKVHGGPQIAMGIGLHFGPALVGYIGSTDRYEYSAVGDTVNTASRLEGLTKELGYPVVLSAVVREKLLAQLGIENLGTHPVKGHAPIEVFGWKP